MTKQEEIREVIDTYTDDVCLYLNTDCEFRSRVPSQGAYCLDGEGAYKCLMKRLCELGVVIKVDRELPQATEKARKDRKWLAAFVCGEMEMIKAGWEATEPLV